MISRPISGAELDLAVSYAYERFGCTLMRHILEVRASRMQLLMQTGTLLPDALRQTLDESKVTGDRRVWYKAALGKLFSSRRNPRRRGKMVKRNRVVKISNPSTIPKILEGNQYAFLFSAL